MPVNSLNAVRKMYPDNFGYREPGKSGYYTDAPNGYDYLQWNKLDASAVEEMLNTMRAAGVELTCTNPGGPWKDGRGETFNEPASYALTNDEKYVSLRIKHNAENKSTCIWFNKH